MLHGPAGTGATSSKPSEARARGVSNLRTGGPATAIWGFSRISTGHCRSPGSARPDQRRDINRLLHTRSYYALLSACGTLITPTQQALYSVADAWAVYGSVDTVFMAARAQVAAGE